MQTTQRKQNHIQAFFHGERDDAYHKQTDVILPAEGFDESVLDVHTDITGGDLR